MSVIDSVAAILPDLGYLESIFETMEWAESEIEKAMARHGEPKPPTGERGKGPIWNSFILLKSTHDKLNREVLYRSHAHEILERVAKGQDTRPGTDAEMIVVIHEATLAAPLTSGAACLYFRVLDRSVPELARATAPEIDLASYEKVHGRVADEYEAELRRKLRQDWRKK
ncbi:hypothetical protein [Streptomyces malaysiensis]|uniref:Uncharacterized protein n=1 Tax=Streptomyces malaysiensis TaxID=92644 RepID=A0A7X6B033_STRMQ|nr:hypothetical protein [Streptomyces malaysiensis]NIY68091.1 hypothetical protein [Streptomyces malaysiensis]